MGEYNFNIIPKLTRPSLVWAWNMKNIQQMKININGKEITLARACTLNFPEPPALIHQLTQKLMIKDRFNYILLNNFVHLWAWNMRKKRGVWTQGLFKPIICSDYHSKSSIYSKV